MFTNVAKYRDQMMEDIRLSGAAYRIKAGFKPGLIIACGFGSRTDQRSVNGLLAKSAIDARSYYGNDLKIIAQSMIASCLKERKVDNYYSVGSNYEKEEKAFLFSNKGLDTRKVIELAKNVIKEYALGDKNVLFIAHPAHIQRVLDVARKMGLKGEAFIRTDMPWSENDQEFWVRSASNWIPREYLSRIHYKVKGYI